LAIALLQFSPETELRELIHQRPRNFLREECSCPVLKGYGKRNITSPAEFLVKKASANIEVE
jgi:hypothetical protein